MLQGLLEDLLVNPNQLCSYLVWHANADSLRDFFHDI
jgi:hypothetical protein